MKRDVILPALIVLGILGFGYLFFFSSTLADLRLKYGSGTLAAFTALGLVVLFLVFVVYFAVRQRRMLEQIEKTNDAVQMIHSGRLAEARQIAAEIVARWPEAHKTVPVLAWNCSVVKYLSGETDEALAEMQALLESEPVRRENLQQLLGTLYAGMSQLCALRGRLEEAEQYLNTARDVQRPNNESAVLLGEMLLLARRKDYGKAVALAAQRWAQIEAFLPVPQYRQFRIVWAFALAQEQHGEHAARIAELMGCARPHFARQYEHLGRHWPELQSFLAAQGVWDA